MMWTMGVESTEVANRKSRVLIVEDHAPTRMAMSRLMRAAGADVVTARDGEEGLG